MSIFRTIDMRAEAPTKTFLSPLSSSRCPKCSTVKKSGAYSCCARGGAWFKNCGDAGSTEFDHTWSEGIQACKDLMSSFSDPSPRQATVHNQIGVAVFPLNTINASQQRTNYRRIGRMSNAAAMDLEGHVEHAKVFFCIYFVFTFT